MKAYEIFIGEQDIEGRFEGKKRIALTLDCKRVEEIIRRYREENEKNQFWIGYETVLNDEGHREIKFYIEEVEVV